MRGGPARNGGGRRWWLAERVLAALTAVALGVDAYLHARHAAVYDAVTGPTVSQGTLFRVEAVVAGVTGLAVLAWPRRLTWAAALVVLATAFGAVLLYRYVDVGTLGPLPNLYEPTWAAPGKVTSAWAEGIGTVLAAAGLAVAVATRARRRRVATPAPELAAR